MRLSRFLYAFSLFSSRYRILERMNGGLEAIICNYLHWNVIVINECWSFCACCGVEIYIFGRFFVQGLDRNI